MGISSRIRDLNETTFSRYWAAFFIWGLLLVILGIIAIYIAELTTLISVIFLGVVILVGGIVIIFDSFAFWWGTWSGFFLHLIMGILYLAVGASLIANPILAAVSLTLLLGIFYIVIGVFRVSYSLSLRVARWGWNFLSGFISILLGVLILAGWPALSLWLIGVFVGIDLVFGGLAYIMSGLYAHSLKKA
jgi:uncharacterized membrane protein HdeD (DUF308 family)